eukprot:TRINITY_DN826_c0_g1_i33.p3 TRINITY_DN826_c0_g1~~TRINITY_DN826_c0_g1_i33.p3  ORF type:complete len:102 (-),score=30.14 TRINITY_DN826_c0_g1_i33:52-357(-)
MQVIEALEPAEQGRCELDREAVFASYAAEFGTKSKTARVIEQQEEEEALEREAVLLLSASYAAEQTQGGHDRSRGCVCNLCCGVWDKVQDHAGDRAAEQGR